jgi:hypothetical protein
MKFNRALFFVAAAFNALVVIGLLIPDSPAWALLGAAPPEQPIFLHLFLVMAAVFGAAYFWIGWDITGKAPLILVAALGKLSVFAVVIAHYVAGSVTLALPLLASGDLIFAVLFLRVYFGVASES